MTTETYIEEIKNEARDVAAESHISLGQQDLVDVLESERGDINIKPKGEYFDPFEKTASRGSVDDVVKAFLSGKLLEARWTAIEKVTTRE